MFEEKRESETKGFQTTRSTKTGGEFMSTNFLSSILTPQLSLSMSC